MGRRDFATQFNYKAIAAGQTTSQVCGEGGFLHSLTVIPASSGAGTVTLFDGTTAIMVTPAFTGGAETKPYTLHLDIIAESTKGFNVTTGASVSVIVSGNYPETLD
jgi:hypothetical protein